MFLRPLAFSTALSALLYACVGDSPSGASPEPGGDDAAVGSSGNAGGSSGASGSGGAGGSSGSADAGDDGSAPDVEPDAVGTVAWARLLPTGGDGFPVARVGVAADGAVVCAYSFTGTVNVLGTQLTATAQSDLALVKLAADGTLVWARAFGGTLSESVYDLAIAPDGTIFVAGGFSSPTLPFDPPLARKGVASSAFVGQFGPDGTPRKGLVFEAAGAAGGNCEYVAVRGDRVAVGCSMPGAAEVVVGGQATTPLRAGAGTNGLVALLDATTLDGIWATVIDSPGPDSTAGVAFAADGDVLFDARVSGAAGNAIKDSKGSVNVVVKDGLAVGRLAASSGLAKWVKGYEVAAGTQLNLFGVAAGKDDSVVFMADLTGTLTFGSQTLASDGTLADLVVGRLAGAGQPLSARAFGGTSEDSGRAFTTDRWGNVLVSGRMSSQGVVLDGKPFPEPVTPGDAIEFLLKASDEFAARWVSGATTANGDLYGLDVAAGHDSRVAQAITVHGTASLGDGEVTQSGAAGAHWDVALILRAP